MMEVVCGTPMETEVVEGYACRSDWQFDDYTSLNKDNLVNSPFTIIEIVIVN